MHLLGRPPNVWMILTNADVIVRYDIDRKNLSSFLSSTKFYKVQVGGEHKRQMSDFVRDCVNVNDVALENDYKVIAYTYSESVHDHEEC
uniref:U3 small nucleolar RNA-associated protein 25 n=1 Tax=Strongyloides venezuelensis TaxID=75913 RepID=A0A0K0G580_STRVS